MQRQPVQRQRIGPAIRRLRQERGMTLDALAAQAGISASHLSRLERSQTLPSFTVLAKIAEVLGVGIDEFVRLERDVTLLDADLGRYLDMLGIGPPVRDELFDLSIEARRTLVGCLRQLGEATLPPLATQELVARAARHDDLAEVWRALNRLIRQAGMGGPAFARAWLQLVQTPGHRRILVASRSFFLLPPEADLVAAYQAVFRREAIDPQAVSTWETSEWVRDPAVMRRWPTRMILSRSYLERALDTEKAGPGPDLARAQALNLCARLLDRLDQDANFELAVTDADLGPFNIYCVAEQGGLIERLPERRGRESTVRVGLWVAGPETTAPVAGLVDRLWDSLPETDRSREAVVVWLRRRQAEASERNPAR